MTTSRYGPNFNNVVACTDEDQKVLESLRFRDQDACLKGGSVLAFAALVIACVLVVMSADPQANVYVRRDTLAYYMLIGGFWLSLVSSLLAFLGVVWRIVNYVEDPRQANLDYYDLIQKKNFLINLSMAAAAAGVVLLVVGSSMAIF